MANASRKKTVSLNEMSHEIDLKKYLGEKPTAEQKKLIAEITEDYIESRTLSGKDINDKDFKEFL